jgi:hypothetical protein
MIIHVKNEEDIYFQDEDLGEIEEVVKYVYFKHHSVNIPVYGVQENSLEIFMTTNDDVKYGINILPNDHFQDFDRDKYIEADWDESKSVTDIDDVSFADFEGQNETEEEQEVLNHFQQRQSEISKQKGNAQEEEKM